jgi:hypothetical protein
VERDEPILVDDRNEDGVRVANGALIGGMAALVTLVAAGLFYQFRRNQFEAAQEQGGNV